jgi:hypothetical protein
VEEVRFIGRVIAFGTDDAGFKSGTRMKRMKAGMARIAQTLFLC